MTTVLIVIHLMVVIAMTAIILLQRSEGGALGIGGGGGALMSRRGAGNVLTRATGFLAIAFFATSIGLTMLARYDERPADILDELGGVVVDEPAVPGDPVVPGPDGGTGVLDALRRGGTESSAPQVPLQ